MRLLLIFLLGCPAIGFAQTVHKFDFSREAAPPVVSVPASEGNYLVTLVFGDDRQDSTTTVRAESRQLLAENVRAKAGESVTRSYTVNVRNSRIAGSDRGVKLKEREVDALRWDEKLSLEFTGKRPAVRSIQIQPAQDVTTVFLAGDSTVTDQQAEPWAGWGQM